MSRVRPKSSPWTDEMLARHASLWAEGHSTLEISRRLGISKNAVVGMAHRMRLPARPSPIKRPAGYVPPPKAQERPRAPVQPVRHIVRAVHIPAAPPPPPKPPEPREAPRHRVEMIERFRRFEVGPTHCCRFPIGDPASPAFRFCEEPAPPGRPYCAAHHKVAYFRSGEKYRVAVVEGGA